MVTKIQRRNKIKARIRGKISGTAARPRMSVFRSNKQIYVQLIDDLAGIPSAEPRPKALRKAQSAKSLPRSVRKSPRRPSPQASPKSFSTVTVTSSTVVLNHWLTPLAMAVSNSKSLWH